VPISRDLLYKAPGSRIIDAPSKKLTRDEIIPLISESLRLIEKT